MSNTHVLVVLSVAPGRGRRARARRRADRRAPRARGGSPRASRRSAARWRASRPSTCARSSRAVDGDQRAVRHHPRRAAGDRAARPRSSPSGGRDDPLVDRQRRPARSSSCRSSSTCCTACSSAARSIVPSVQPDRDASRPPASKDLDAAALLLTTQDQVTQTVAGVANYGGSLDVILDDADEAQRCPQPESS